MRDGPDGGVVREKTTRKRGEGEGRITHRARGRVNMGKKYALWYRCPLVSNLPCQGDVRCHTPGRVQYCTADFYSVFVFLCAFGEGSPRDRPQNVCFSARHVQRSRGLHVFVFSPHINLCAPCTFSTASTPKRTHKPTHPVNRNVHVQPIVPPEDLAAEQDFRWRSSGRDSTASAAASTKGASRRRAKPRPSSATRSSKRQARRGREGEPGWEDEEYRHRGGGRRTAGGRRDGRGEEDELAIAQLRRKQRQLADREYKCEVDLEKVRRNLLFSCVYCVLRVLS